MTGLTAFVTNLRNELSRREVFEKRVSFKTSSQRFGLGVLLTGVGLLLVRLTFIFTNMPGNFTWLKFWSLLFYDTGYSSRGALIQTAAKWGMLILIPLGIVALAFARFTRASAVEKLFQGFQERGFVVVAEPIGLVVEDGDDRFAVNVVSHPSVSDEDFAAFVTYMRNEVTNPQSDVKRLKGDLSSKAVRAGMTPVQQLYPGAPAGLRFYAAAQEAQAWAVVYDAAGKPSYYAIK